MSEEKSYEELKAMWSKHQFTVCIPWNCEFCANDHKMYCCKEDRYGANPSKELMLDCALRYNWDRADELERLRAWRRLAQKKEEK